MPEKMTIGDREITVYNTDEVSKMTGFSWSYIKSRIYDGTIPSIAIPARSGTRVAKYYIPDYVVETIPGTCFRRRSGRPRKTMEQGETPGEINENDFLLATSGKYDMGLEIETIDTTSTTVNAEISMMDRFKRLLGRA